LKPVRTLDLTVWPSAKRNGGLAAPGTCLVCCRRQRRLAFDLAAFPLEALDFPALALLEFDELLDEELELELLDEFDELLDEELELELLDEFEDELDEEFELELLDELELELDELLLATWYEPSL
jgi:hypothetical protein